MCFIGKTRNYPPEERDLVDDRIANYIKLRSSKSLPPNNEGNPAKRMKTEDPWSEGFTPRSSEEKSRNCKTVNAETVTYIVQTVFSVLLNSPDCETRQLEDSRVWRKGGRLMDCPKFRS